MATPGVSGNYKVNGMPDHVREKIDQYLIEGNFRGYAELHRWVNELLATEELEMSIAKSSLIRYGQQLRDTVQRLKEQTFVASQLKEWCPDDSGMVAEMSVQIVLSELLSRVSSSGGEMKLDELTKVARAIADAVRSHATTRRFQMEFQARVEAAANRVEQLGREGGLGDDTIQTINATILGISEG